jgi:hypothetical protein
MGLLLLKTEPNVPEVSIFENAFASNDEHFPHFDGRCGELIHLSSFQFTPHHHQRLGRLPV